MDMVRLFLAGIVALLVPSVPLWAEAPPRDVTFIVTSDSHYVEVDRKNSRNESNRVSIEEMNHIQEATWPQKLGGDRVSKPRGVLLLGDCIDEGDKAIKGRSIAAEQYAAFVADFGLDGTDGRLKIPVFEGWGNHDGPPAGKEKNGFSFQAHLKDRTQKRLADKRVSNVSENGLHYSWDWDDVHFVQLNLYPADRQREGVHYSAEWHNPQDCLAFLKKDLAEKVGASGRPVILMSHCGFDTDWWLPKDWEEVYTAAKSYNVVLYLYGHSGTKIQPWAPAGEKKWMCINDGQTEKGFFVVQLKGDRIRASMRVKGNYTVTKGADGSVMSDWDKTWGWKWELDRAMPPIGAPAAAKKQ
jgi:cytolysin (calcineurin-like family phosphatase)